MKRKILVFSLIVFAVGAAGLAAFVVSRSALRPQGPPQPPSTPPGGLDQAASTTERVVAPVQEPPARVQKAEPPPVVRQPLVTAVAAAPIQRTAPVRIYTAASYSVEPPKAETKPATDPLPFAPAFRLVRCRLFNTIDSSTPHSPLIGVVTDDLVWGGEVVIPKCTEIHGVAQIGQSQDRIVAEGPFTFVFQDGRQLVVNGEALERNYDPRFKTFSALEASGGILGQVIRTDKAAEIKLFVASFISGVAQGLKGTTSGLFGVYEDPNAKGVGGLSGYAINPTVQAAQNVLDLYAARVLEGIQKRGYFVVVPAGTQFNFYSHDDVDLAKATYRGDQVRRDAKAVFLSERRVDDEVSLSRDARDELRAQERQNVVPVPSESQLEGLNAQVQRVSGQLETNSQTLRAKSNALSAQAQNQQ